MRHTSPKRRDRASFRPALVMLAKLNCSIVSIGAAILPLFPHRWTKTAYFGMTMRACTAAMAAIPMVAHLRDLVFDELFLATCNRSKPWLLPALCSLLTGVERTLVHRITTFGILFALPFSDDRVVSVICSAWAAISFAFVDQCTAPLLCILVDRALVRHEYCICSMLVRQLVECAMIYSIVRTAFEETDDRPYHFVIRSERPVLTPGAAISQLYDMWVV